LNFSGGNGIWSAGSQWSVTATTTSDARLTFSVTFGPCTLAQGIFSIQGKGTCYISVTAPATNRYRAISYTTYQEVYDAPTEHPIEISPPTERFVGNSNISVWVRYYQVASNFLGILANSRIPLNASSWSVTTSTPGVCTVILQQTTSSGITINITKKAAGTCNYQLEFKGQYDYLPPYSATYPNTYVYYLPNTFPESKDM
jgi:hypothetical protein